MKKIIFSKHSLIQCEERGAELKQVETAIFEGIKEAAQKDRTKYTMNFQFNALWNSKYYPIKQIIVVTVEEGETIIVITVITKFF